MRSGTWRNNLKGEAAYRSFVPADLQTITISYTDALVSLIGKVHDAAAAFRFAYGALTEEGKKTYREAMAGREAEASVLLAGENKEAGPLLAGNGILNLMDIGHMMERKKDPLTEEGKQDAAWLADAISYGEGLLEKLPLSGRFLEEIHDYVMHADHNYEKMPGELRRSVTWLAKGNAPLKEANFVFPNVDDMKQGLYRLEDYIHREDALDPFLKAALLHYQFEVLHPFLDGNGRVGRLFHNLYLADKGILPTAAIPLSEVLHENEFGYYIHLRLVEQDGDYEGWAVFWLNALLTALERAMLEIRNQMSEVRK